MTLSQEITLDPLARGYAVMSDSEVVASLLLVDRPAPVPSSDVRKFLHLTGEMDDILTSLSAAAKGFVDALDTFEDFDLQDPAIQTAVWNKLEALRTATPSLLSAASRDTLMAMENNRRSRASELGLLRVTEGAVSRVRG